MAKDKEKKEKKPNSGLKKLVIVLAVLIIGIPASAFGYLYFKLNSMYDRDADDSIFNSANYRTEKGITNILLVGSDALSDDETARSDSMMILTVDSINDSMKLTSLARDSYVAIPGRQNKEKLTHAYAYGGINLLTETIEDNFELDIQYYASVNFLSFMDIVDVLGGVEVEVQQDYISELEKYTRRCYNLSTNPNKGSLEIISTPGTHTLNGYQALAFCRIRYNDSAIERDRRQQEVIQGIFDGISDLPLTSYPALIDSILPHVSTNMKPTQIMSLATTALGINDKSIKQFNFPVHDGVLSTGGIINNQTGWVLQFEPETLDILHDFIFEDVNPEDHPMMQ